MKYTEIRIRLDELYRLKKVDCFNEPYTSDARPSKLVDVRIKELQNELSKWKTMDASDDVPFGDPDK